MIGRPVATAAHRSKSRAGPAGSRVAVTVFSVLPSTASQMSEITGMSLGHISPSSPPGTVIGSPDRPPEDGCTSEYAPPVFSTPNCRRTAPTVIDVEPIVIVPPGGAPAQARGDHGGAVRGLHGRVVHRAAGERGPFTCQRVGRRHAGHGQRGEPGHRGSQQSSHVDTSQVSGTGSSGGQPPFAPVSVQMEPWVSFTALPLPDPSPVSSGSRSSVTPHPVNGGIVTVPLSEPPPVSR